MKIKPYLFLFFSLASYFLLPSEFGEMPRRTLAIFVFAILFWAFEVIDLYATSIWIVVFLSFFVRSQEGTRDYSLYFSSLANPVILLFFGGFILAAAVRKHRIDEWILVKILSLAGPNPKAVLAAVLGAGAFFSLWISNTAAAAMVFALCTPLLGRLSQDDPMRKSIPLAVAFGTNVGGMGTPIGTPPNAIVLGILREYGHEIGFGAWMAMAIPLVVLILILIFFLLWWFFPSRGEQLHFKVDHSSPLSSSGKKTMAIGTLMILLWVFGSWVGISESWVALAGVATLASMGLVQIEDLHRIEWHVLLLMWGGLALGTGIENSRIIPSDLSFLTGHHYLGVIAVFCLAALFMSTFISNTATANLLLPFAVGIASVETALIAIPVALSCSLAMSLPVSTPPNAIAYSSGFLKTADMVKAGVIAGVASLLLILAGFQWVIPRFT
jgi:sodium-dependent dicarboxylate transporter 2/3/5